MKKHNFAIIGLGNVADFQIKALLLSEELQLVAACDIDPDKKTKLPQDVLFYTDSEDLLRNTEVDAVLVSTPHNQHFPVARLALLSGKDVLLEKPATSTLGEFDELVTLARSKERLLVIAFHAAFAMDLQWFQEAYASMLSTELGPLTGFNCGFYDPYIEDSNLRTGAVNLVGSWTDSGINALSVIGQLMSFRQEVCK